VKKELLKKVPTPWLEPVVKLDSAVSSPGFGATPVWWKRWLHRAIPSFIFDTAMFELLSRQKYRKNVGAGPAYGTVGKDPGLQCIDSKFHPAVIGVGEAILPRMVRTSSGRVALQHQLIKESLATAGDDDFFVPGGD
jgi:hypothetical protein